MPITDWLPYSPPLYINIGFGLGLTPTFVEIFIHSVENGLNINRIGLIQTKVNRSWKTLLEETVPSILLLRQKIAMVIMR